MQSQQNAKIPLYKQYKGQIQKNQGKAPLQHLIKAVHSPDLSAGQPSSSKQEAMKQKQFIQSHSTPRNNNSFIQMHQQILQKQKNQHKLNNSACDQINTSFRPKAIALSSPQSQLANQLLIKGSQQARKEGKDKQNMSFQNQGERCIPQQRGPQTQDESIISQGSFGSLNLQEFANKINQSAKKIRRIESEQHLGRKPPFPITQKNQDQNQNIQIFASGFAFKTKESSPKSPGIFSQKQFMQYQRLGDLDSVSQPNSTPNTSRASKSPRRTNSQIRSAQNTRRDQIQRKLHNEINLSFVNQDSFFSNQNEYSKNISFAEILPSNQSTKQKIEQSKQQSQIVMEEEMKKQQLRQKIDEILKYQKDKPPIIKATDISKKFQLDFSLLTKEAKLQKTPKSLERDNQGFNNFSIKFQ